MRIETLYTCVNYIDRYLASCSGVERYEFQLIGISCLMIAAKMIQELTYELMDIRTCVYLTDNAYTRQQVQSMEIKILHTLQFDLMCITPIHFLDHFCDAAADGRKTTNSSGTPEAETKLKCLTSYICAVGLHWGILVPNQQSN